MLLVITLAVGGLCFLLPSIAFVNLNNPSSPVTRNVGVGLFC